MRGWKEWKFSEKGIVIGLILGIVVLIILLFTDYGDLNFCFLNFESKDLSLCFRWVALVPLSTVILGLVIGAIIDLVKKNNEKFPVKPPANKTNSSENRVHLISD